MYTYIYRFRSGAVQKLKGHPPNQKRSDTLQLWVAP